ncbi:MAG: hypothetical protein IKP95_10060 [Ruminococcus sp.]|nr:hypothetical protein [Ruminococcus sp.]
MSVFSAAVLCLAVCAVSSLLRDNGDIRLALIVTTAAVLFSGAAEQLAGIRDLIKELLDKSGLDELYLKVIFKGLGICFISQISADCCRDSGQSALASQIELVGKLSMIAVSLPLFRAVIEITEALLI